MIFWDSSALLPLIVHEASSAAMMEVARADPEMVVSWITHCECFSALARLEREGTLTEAAFDETHHRLVAFSQSWYVVTPGSQLLVECKRVLRLHALRSGDAIQLASAILAADRTPSNLKIAVLDSRLRSAAKREGLGVIPAQ